MTGADSFVELDGLRLHYCEYGSPASAPLVLLHGVTMEAHSWDQFAAQVQDRFHVLALTARGHGDSDRAADYGAMEHIADASRFIDGLVRGPTVVCGLSMGGVTAIGLAALHPEQVSKLVIVEVSPLTAEATHRLESALSDTPDSWASYEEALPAFHAGYGDISDAALLAYMPRVLRRDADGRLRGKLDPQVVAQRAPQEPALDPNDLLLSACKAIRCPTLIVRGSRSYLSTRDGVENMLRAIPDARLVEVDASHAVPLDNPAGFYDAVRTFI